MIKILMSDFKHYHKVDGEKVANAIDNTNGIVDHIKEYLMDTNVILFIASSPEDKEKMSLYSKLLFVLHFILYLTKTDFHPLCIS